MFNIESVLNLQTIGTQLLQSFLPETTICLVVLYLLTVLAIELGEKRSKRALALETLNAIRFALLPIIGMYLYMLLSGDYSEIQTALNGYFYNSQYSITLKLLLLICAFVVVHSSEDYMRRHTMHLLEYPIVLATAILFMLLLASANHLISAFLTLVGFSLNLYVLIYSDAPVKVAREAGIKYYYLSTFSSGLLIYGCFVIYSLLGTGNFEEIALLLRGYQEASHNNLFLALGFSYLLGGLFFKLSAFPGHLWAADVYEGSPAPITALFMLPVKIAVLALFIRLLTTAFAELYNFWVPGVTLAAVGSLLWGALAAYRERVTRRFMAYTSINQMGFLLTGIATGTPEGYRATLIYLLVYAAMSIIFLLVFIHARRDDDRQSLLYLSDFRGLGQTNWWVSAALIIVLFSMAGIPPLAGFFAKYYVLLHALEQGLYLLVATGLFTSLLSAYYYLRLVKILWFEGNEALSSASVAFKPSQEVIIFSTATVLVGFIILLPYLSANLNAVTETLLGS